MAAATLHGMLKRAARSLTGAGSAKREAAAYVRTVIVSISASLIAGLGEQVFHGVVHSVQVGAGRVALHVAVGQAVPGPAAAGRAMVEDGRVNLAADSGQEVPLEGAVRCAQAGDRGGAGHDGGLNGQAEQEVLRGGAAEDGGRVGAGGRDGGQVDGGSHRTGISAGQHVSHAGRRAHGAPGPDVMHAVGRTAHGAADENACLAAGEDGGEQVAAVSAAAVGVAPVSSARFGGGEDGWHDVRGWVAAGFPVTILQLLSGHGQCVDHGSQRRGGATWSSDHAGRPVAGHQQFPQGG